jgi:hypothetical protein
MPTPSLNQGALVCEFIICTPPRLKPAARPRRGGVSRARAAIPVLVELIVVLLAVLDTPRHRCCSVLRRGADSAATFFKDVQERSRPHHSLVSVSTGRTQGQAAAKAGPRDRTAANNQNTGKVYLPAGVCEVPSPQRVQCTSRSGFPRSFVSGQLPGPGPQDGSPLEG